MKTTKLTYYNNCVNWYPEEMHALYDIVDNGREIKRSTFLRYVDRTQLDNIATGLGYGPHLQMQNDRHVKYYRTGNIVYFTWSAIEYVFAKPETIKQRNAA